MTWLIRVVARPWVSFLSGSSALPKLAGETGHPRVTVRALPDNDADINVPLCGTGTTDEVLVCHAPWRVHSSLLIPNDVAGA